MKGARLSFCFAEMQPVLSKDSEYLGQYKNRQFGFYIYYDKKRTTKNCSLVVRLYNGCNLTNSQITSSGSS